MVKNKKKQKIGGLYISLILGISIVGMILRFILAFNQNGVWYDQVLYCHEAQNILNGRWQYIHTNENNFYTLQESGLSIYNHPLYPLLIALLSLVTRSLELSGTIISLCAHLFMVFLIYLICQDLMGKNWAVGVLAVLSFSLRLIEISISKYAESLYMLFLALTAYYFLQFYRCQQKVIYPLLAGFALGCAYLTKPEALVLIPIFTLPVIMGLRWKNKLNLKHNLLFLLTFGTALFITILPYSLYLKSVLGDWQPTPKILYNLVVAERMETMDFRKAYWELNEQGNDTILSERVSTEKLWDFVKSNLSHLVLRSLVNMYHILNIIISPFFGYQALLFVFGFFTSFVITRKSDQKRKLQIWLGTFLFLQLIPYSIMIFLRRPLITVLPIITILTFYSISQIVVYIAGNLKRPEYYISIPIVIFVSSLTLISSLLNYQDTVTYVKSFVYSQEVGKWLSRNTKVDSIIMSKDPEIPYYANRRHIILPFESENRIYNYGQLKGAKYLVKVESTVKPHDNLSTAKTIDNPSSLISDKFLLVGEFHFPHRKAFVYKLRSGE